MKKITQNSKLKSQNCSSKLKTKKLIAILFSLKDKGFKIADLSFEICLLSYFYGFELKF